MTGGILGRISRIVFLSLTQSIEEKTKFVSNLKVRRQGRTGLFLIRSSILFTSSTSLSEVLA